MLEVNLFGSARARYADHPLNGFPNQQPSLLLCYLLLNRGRNLSRERLAAVFWGEYPTPVSLKYLRNCIWRMRKGLESAGIPTDAYLSVSDGGVSFRRSGRYWLDVEVFETQLTPFHSLPGEVLTPEQATQLGKAVDLYAGDLLEGVYEDWCLCDRERLRLAYLEALGKLIAFHEARGEYEQGLACGERILAHDNIRESVHRQMMRLYWLQGDRAAALAQYKRCAQVLREALGIQPMDETTRLYQQIAHSQFQPAVLREAPLTWAVDPDGSQTLAAEYILQRVHYLQAMVEEARTELGAIEPLLRDALLHGQAPVLPPAKRAD